MISLTVGGWALALGAAQAVPVVDNTASHLRFLATVIGGALAFMGMFAGISRWVAEPAARKILAEHTTRGAAAHLELVARLEWDEKHLALVREMTTLAVAVTNLTARLDERRSGR